MKDYFTANRGRKIFFWGLIFAILCFILLGVCRGLLNVVDENTDFALVSMIKGLRYASMIAILVAIFGTLWDSMQSRTFFLKKIRDIQYEHLKTIHDKQTAGEAVEMTPTFNDEEKKYLRRRKWNFILMIIFKVSLVIALFSLLLGM